jgi:hypothetical protein
MSPFQWIESQPQCLGERPKPDEDCLLGGRTARLAKKATKEAAAIQVRIKALYI